MLIIIGVMILVFLVLLLIKKYREYQSKVRKREVEELCPEHFSKLKD